MEYLKNRLNSKLVPIKTVRPERTGWRDLRLNNRHRAYGINCPALDIDLLLLEYDKSKAAALVEYKHEKAEPQYARHPTYQALIDLGNRALIPVFCARYANDFSWYKAVPLNPCAKVWLSEITTMTEKEWVILLYKIRGYDSPTEVLKNLGGRTLIKGL